MEAFRYTIIVISILEMEYEGTEALLDQSNSSQQVI